MCAKMPYLGIFMHKKSKSEDLLFSWQHLFITVLPTDDRRAVAYANAAFACATIAENAGLSNTAKSAKTLRSISIEAFFKP